MHTSSRSVYVNLRACERAIAVVCVYVCVCIRYMFTLLIIMLIIRSVA